MSELTTNRLSIYLRCLNELHASGVLTVAGAVLLSVSVAVAQSTATVSPQRLRYQNDRVLVPATKVWVTEESPLLRLVAERLLLLLKPRPNSM